MRLAYQPRVRRRAKSEKNICRMDCLEHYSPQLSSAISARDHLVEISSLSGLPLMRFCFAGLSSSRAICGNPRLGALSIQRCLINGRHGTLVPPQHLMSMRLAAAIYERKSCGALSLTWLSSV